MQKIPQKLPQKLPRLLALLLGTAVVLGLPPAMLLSNGSGHPAPVVTQADDPMLQVLAARSQVTRLYEEWQQRYVATGGDRDVRIGLGYVKGLTPAATGARGTARLDLLAGTAQVTVSGLDEPAEVWLVDNQDGPGRSVMPETGDHMVKLGRLSPAGTVRASLGESFFDRFELDLVVVSRTGESPATSRLLMGSRPYFERLYTQTRVAAAARQPDGPFGALLSLGALLSPQEAHANSSSILVAHGLVTQQVADGADLFFRGTFNGNGRTCGTCHPPEKNQEIGPEFIATLPSTDKLFVAEFPASQGGVPGLEIPALMRQFGLILENVDGAENPTVKFTMRGVPHSLSMSTSILAPADGRAPVERTGWSGDGAPETGALRFFPVGATFQHFTKSLNRVAGVDFTFPTDSQLDAMEAFMLSAGRTNDLDLSATSLANSGAENGRVVFLGTGKCNNCHLNAGANAPGLGNANGNFDTGVEDLTDPSQAVVSHPGDGGFGVTPAVDTDGDGVADLFGDGTFNSTPLVEAADTGPFFHNNVIDTIEGAVAFYNSPEFQASPSGQFIGGINMTAQEVQDVAAFLRVVNAAFNIDQAVQRVEAGAELENGLTFDGPLATRTSTEEKTTGKRDTVNALLALANIEAADAVEVLNERGLNPTAQSELSAAISDAEAAIATSNSKTRSKLMSSARNHLLAAKADLGSGLSFLIGEGNLLF